MKPRVAIAALALGLAGCGYTWGIEHTPLIGGPGPHSAWMRVIANGAPYDVDLHFHPSHNAGGGRSPAFVIVLHGANGSGPGMERRTRFSELADSVGFVVAYPNSLENRQGRRLWGTPESIVSDTSMLRAVIDSAAARYGIDRQHVFLTGFSNGGGMAYRAAQGMPGVFAGIGVVAGAGGVASVASSPRRPIPLIAVHGMLDSTVIFNGAGAGRGSAPGSVRAWAQHNGCNLTSRVDTLGEGEFIRTSFESCPMRANVVLYAMVHGRHGWPNRGTREAPFNTTATIWSFLSAHTY